MITILLATVLMISLFGMIYAIAALIQSRDLASTAPKDVQEAIGEHPERFAGQHLLGWILMIACIVAFAGAFVYGGWDGIHQGYGLMQFFLRFLIMLYLEKAFDIICIDYFLLSKSNFFQHYFPETAHCKGYKEFGFNRKQQIGRLILYPIIAVLLAGLCTIIK